MIVSIHAPAWGATRRRLAVWERRSSFNPRARVGRDTLIRRTPRLSRCVSIHAPAWGATQHRPANFAPAGVSIHAPAWGATHAFSMKSTGIIVSIHAPAWGATRQCASIIIAGLLFQSTRPRGARLAAKMGVTSVAIVSIHAPAWGATRCFGCGLLNSQCFNPRARVGRDQTNSGQPH